MMLDIEGSDLACKRPATSPLNRLTSRSEPGLALDLTPKGISGGKSSEDLQLGNLYRSLCHGNSLSPLWPEIIELFTAKS